LECQRSGNRESSNENDEEPDEEPEPIDPSTLTGGALARWRRDVGYGRIPAPSGWELPSPIFPSNNRELSHEEPAGAATLKGAELFAIIKKNVY